MSGRTSEPFIGRAIEIDGLDHVLAAARAGAGGTALICGEAGIGKSRLAAEMAVRARGTGFEVLRGQCLDLVGTDLPYQPLVQALRPLRLAAGGRAPAPRSQLHVFEETLGLLRRRASAVPVLLILEDLHWADASTLDLVVYLAHQVEECAVVLLITRRPNEGGDRLRRAVDGVRKARTWSVTLGPLAPESVAELLAARSGGVLPAGLVSAIAARSEGNPFFAEELLSVARDGAPGELPESLRELLLRRVSGLDPQVGDLLRIAAITGREVTPDLLLATSGLPELQLRPLLRAAVDHGVLVVAGSSRLRFRHALVAEAIQGTVLPGEREQIHGSVAEYLAAHGGSAAELAQHWHAAGRAADAFSASIAAAREGQAAFGLAEAHLHLERALTLWPEVPDARERAGLDRVALLAWAVRLAGETGAAARAVELGREGLRLLGTADPARACRLQVTLAEYLFDLGQDEAGRAAMARAVNLVPAAVAPAERAYALSSLAGALMVGSRHAESLPLAADALALARQAGAGEAVVRALTVLGIDHAYLGQTELGLGLLRESLTTAGEIGDLLGLDRAYINLTDVLTMLGRHRESAELARTGLAVTHEYGFRSSLLAANLAEALLIAGDWAEADCVTAAEMRTMTGSFPYALFMLRACLEAGRGQFEAARRHYEAARTTLPADHDFGIFEIYLAELALWEGRWTDALGLAQAALALARLPPAAGHLRAWFCARALRAQAELAAFAQVGRDPAALAQAVAGAEVMIDETRTAVQAASRITRNSGGWLALAEAEYHRALGRSDHDLWARAADSWDDLDRAPEAAYCRWRRAEALIVTGHAGAGAGRAAATESLREACAIAGQLQAQPLLTQVERLAQQARISLAPPSSHVLDQAPRTALGLTRREAEVLSLIASGLTNREIAGTLTISVSTASVHVSNILRKLDAPNRQEAAAIAHRIQAGPQQPMAAPRPRRSPGNIPDR
jgi:DNA-binding CsgD family transcriptional regulator/tetratricopeptide (TPR) repeat protein